MKSFMHHFVDRGSVRIVQEGNTLRIEVEDVIMNRVVIEVNRADIKEWPGRGVVSIPGVPPPQISRSKVPVDYDG